MTKETVAKLPGLHERGGVYQLRVMIPSDLQQAYAGRTKLVRSLNTKDHREAARLGASVRAEVLQEFEDKRRALNPQPVAQVAPQLGETLAASIRAAMLQWDDTLRTQQDSLRAFLSLADAVQASALRPLMISRSDLAPPARPAPAYLSKVVDASPFDGMTPAQLQRLAEVNAGADEAARMALAGRKLGAVVALADSQARRLGLLVDWKTPEAQPVLMACLRAYRAACADIVKRDEGQDIEAPTLPQQLAAPTLTYLDEVFKRWKASKRRSPDTERACLRALEMFEGHAGHVPVQKITRAHGDAFRAWLLGQGTTTKTAHDRMTWVKSLLVYACDDLELIPKQPWRGLDITTKTTNRRKPWTTEQQAAFLGQPLYTERKLPKDPKAGQAAAYWIPLLALYTGARVGELCQLRVVDVQSTPAGYLLNITDEDEDARVKTEAGIRSVPLHSELVRLGFLDYVEEVKATGAALLWPAMRFRAGKPGAYFSDWFGQHRREYADPPQWSDLHSLRHLVRTDLMEAGVSEAVIDRIAGHANKGSEGNRTYAHPVAILRAAVEQLKPPTAHLQPWKGATLTL